MSFTPANVRRSASRAEGRQASAAVWVLVASVLVAGSGCGVEEQAWQEPGQAPDSQAQGVQIVNGVFLNGVFLNGVFLNGVFLNGVIAKGLTSLQLVNNADFDTWFNEAPADRDTLMHYIVKCAVANGQTRTYINPATGLSYSWSGALGLTPGWASGLAATTDEQQVVTACLAAHANKFGVHVNVSMLGLDALNIPIPYTSAELATYSETEGCFFGSAFNDGVMYAGSDRATLAPEQSSSRACAMSWAGGAADCSPIVHVGSCSQYCTKDTTGTYYTSCTYEGVTYKPFTTRIAPGDIFTCGDGVCQVSERCGTGSTYNNCGLDCGGCPR